MLFADFVTTVAKNYNSGVSIGITGVVSGEL